MMYPSSRCNEMAAPPTSGNNPSIALARYTSATSTISIATILSRSSRPDVVPLTIASMVEEACTSGSTSAAPVLASPTSGTMIRLIRIAAGAPSTEAITKWAAASEISGARNVAYSTSTVPAIPAMPPVITKNNSARGSLPRYGRMNSGASTMPRKIWGAGAPTHAPGHHKKHRGWGGLPQIRREERRRFAHAKKDMGGGGKPPPPADPKRAFQQPRYAAHHRRQNAPIEQQRRQYAHDEH